MLLYGARLSAPPGRSFAILKLKNKLKCIQRSLRALMQGVGRKRLEDVGPLVPIAYLQILTLVKRKHLIRFVIEPYMVAL
jgi:hypothetical protein